MWLHKTVAVIASCVVGVIERMQNANSQQRDALGSGFERIKGLSWDDIFRRSAEELGREPDSHEVQSRMLEMLNHDPFEYFEWG